MEILLNEGTITETIENIAAKGEFAGFNQFLLLSQCFQKLSAAEELESVYMWERIKQDNDQFLLLTQCFLFYSSPMHEVQGELL